MTLNLWYLWHFAVFLQIFMFLSVSSSICSINMYKYSKLSEVISAESLQHHHFKIFSKNMLMGKTILKIDTKSLSDNMFY